MLARTVTFLFLLLSSTVAAASYCDDTTLSIRTSMNEWKPQSMQCTKDGHFEVELKAGGPFVFKFDESKIALKKCKEIFLFEGIRQSNIQTETDCSLLLFLRQGTRTK